MSQFKPNHFVDGPFIELHKPRNPVLRSHIDSDKDDEVNSTIRKKDGFDQSLRIRAIGRGNYGSNNYQLVIEVLEILVSLAPLEVTSKEPKRREAIIASYIPTGKRNMSYEQCSAEIDALRPLFKDPKKTETLIKPLKLPAELKEWYLEKINPYKNISTAMVTSGSSVLFIRKYDEEGKEVLSLPVAKIDEGYRDEINIMNAFYRAGGVRIEQVRLQPQTTDTKLRIVFQGATAILNPAANSYAMRQGTPVTLVQKDDLLTDTRIDADSRRYLLWMKEEADKHSKAAQHEIAQKKSQTPMAVSAQAVSFG